MTQTKFTDIINNGKLVADPYSRTKAFARAQSWYQSLARSSVGATTDISIRSRIASKITPGTMYMYTYDPKWKDKLPYYDTFPLIFPVDFAEGGFYGLNLHYLHPKARAILMDKLYTFASDQKMDTKTKLNLSYNLLKSTEKLKLFKPCFKRYLVSHVRSKFLTIYPNEWELALMLPLQQFQKKSAQYVWDESARIAGIKRK